MTNFDFLLKDRQFSSFAPIAVKAEHLLHIDTESSVLACRRAMEFAVKWMYSVDDALEEPDSDSLSVLMSEHDFKELVDDDVYRRMEYIRKLGNSAAHASGRSVSLAEGTLCLQNLYYFMDFVACCYQKGYRETPFDPKLLELTAAEALSFVTEGQEELTRLLSENRALKAELTARREQRQQSYVPKPLSDADAEARRLYLDMMLEDAGWRLGEDALKNVPLPGGLTADTVLYDGQGRPLALLQTFETDDTRAASAETARRLAETLQKQSGLLPVVFLSDGLGAFLLPQTGEPRPVSGIYSKEDLTRRHATSRQPVAAPANAIADRPYQVAAVERLNAAFAAGARRQLLVMAAGAGKTRTVVSLCETLLRQGRAGRILYLADRPSLVAQAVRVFGRLLPGLPVAELGQGGLPDPGIVFSTYETLDASIDELRVGGRRVLTPGRFDLVICDEARSAAGAGSRDCAQYFDACLLGLTGTPASELDAATLSVFTQDGKPAFVYSEEEAVRDGYLVPAVQTPVSLPVELPEGDALRETLCREDVIEAALSAVFSRGLTVNGGRTLGKTILFAEDRRHAQRIEEVFREKYPRRAGELLCIDGQTRKALDALDAFADPLRDPRVAVSAGTLDNGADIPSVVNLAFLCRVTDRETFRQMLGRGTRPCPGLMDGADKDRYLALDFCGNFAALSPASPTAFSPAALTGARLRQQLALVALLGEHPADAKLAAFRKSLIATLTAALAALPKESFAVRRHLRDVTRYADAKAYAGLTRAEARRVGTELAALPQPEETALPLRFDVLVFDLQIARLTGRDAAAAENDLASIAKALLGQKTQTASLSGILEKLAYTGLPAAAGVVELEAIRRALRQSVASLPEGERLFTAPPLGQVE